MIRNQNIRSKLHTIVILLPLLIAISGLFLLTRVGRAAESRNSYSNRFDKIFLTSVNPLNLLSTERSDLFKPYSPIANRLLAQHLPDNVHVYDGNVDCDQVPPPSEQVLPFLQIGVENQGIPGKHMTICVKDNDTYLHSAISLPLTYAI